MCVSAVAWWWQKHGSAEREYEDAFAVGGGRGDGRIRVAIADGATESMLSGRWAQSLVGTYTRSRRLQLLGCISRALRGWPGSLQEYKERREQDGRPIAWYEEPGLERGAHATLLVAEFRSGPDGRTGTWTAEAIGDSCLFHVSGDGLQTAFPLVASKEFGSAPALVHTGVRSRRLLHDHRAVSAGTWSSGDSFFLCTDALAEWFLAQHEQSAEPWGVWAAFRSSGSEEDFRGWVADERRAGRLKNDDVTLVNVRCD